MLRARGTKLDRIVALKALAPEVAASPMARKRFLREAKAAGRLHHTNIVPVFEVGQDGANAFYAMQLIEGESLDAVIGDLRRLRGGPESTALEDEPSQSGKLAASMLSDSFRAENLAEPSTPSAGAGVVGTGDTGADASASDTTRTGVLPGTDGLSTTSSSRRRFYRSIAQVGVQVAEALSYAHARGIIHRDIKPSNLLLDAAGVVWVTDFGVARTDDHGMTQPGDIVGTIRYMAPERFEGKSDARVDVYALGLTLYELIALKPPFEAPDRLELLRTITSEEPAALHSVDARVPRDLETIVLKAIEKAPGSRYQSADELAEDLRRFVDDEPILARRASLAEQFSRWVRRNRRLAVAVAVVVLLTALLAVGAMVAAVTFRRQREDLRHLAREKERQADLATREAERASTAERKAIDARDEAQKQKQALVRADEVKRRNLYTAQMNSAGYAAMRPEGVGQVLRLTDKWIPKAGDDDLRGWEWYYLRSLCHTEELTLPGRHLFLKSARWSPDGTLLACIHGADTKKVVVVWDAVSGRVLLEGTPVKSMDTRVQLTLRLSWSPDGKRLACGAWSGEIFVLDAATGAVVLRYKGHTKPVLVMSWSPDGSQLASGDRGGTVKVWNAATGEAVHTLAGHTQAVRCFSWHPRDKRMASASWDATVRVWDTVAGKELHTFRGHGEAVWSVSWSPDGKRLASAGKEGKVEIWSGETYTRLRKIDAHPNRIASVDWSPDGKQLATAGEDHSVQVWDAATGQQIAMLQGHRACVFSVEWSPDGKRLASAAGDDTVKVWGLSMKDRNRDYPAGDREVNSVRWSPDGTRLATGGNAVRWWRARLGGDPVVLMKAGQARAVDVSWDPKGTRLAAGCADGKVRVWDTDTAKLLHTITALPSWATVQLVRWSPDGTQLAETGVGSETIQIWDAATGVQRLSVTQDSKFTALPLRWSTDGATLISGSGPVIEWHAARGWKLRTLGEPRRDVGAPAWSPDGKKLASVKRDQTVELWDLGTGKSKILIGHTGRVRSVCWSPDGTRVASAGNDRTVRVWDTATGEEVLVLEGKCNLLYGVDWSPDGKRIVACGFGDKVTVWDATIGYRRELQRLKRKREAAPAKLPARNGAD